MVIIIIIIITVMSYIYKHHLLQLFSNSRSHHNAGNNCASKQQCCVCNSWCSWVFTTGQNIAAQTACGTAKTASCLHHSHTQTFYKQSWNLMVLPHILYLKKNSPDCPQIGLLDTSNPRHFGHLKINPIPNWRYWVNPNQILILILTLSLTSHAEDHISCLTGWFYANKLSLSIHKTCHSTFGVSDCEKNNNKSKIHNVLKQARDH